VRGGRTEGFVKVSLWVAGRFGMIQIKGLVFGRISLSFDLMPLASCALASLRSSSIFWFTLWSKHSSLLQKRKKEFH